MSPRLIFSSQCMLPAAKKDVLPANQKSMVIYEYVCHCDSRTTQRLQERIKQHAPKAIRQKNTLIQKQGNHRSQPIKTQPNRKCKAKSKTQFEPESDSAIGQHLLESNQCARNYSLLSVLHEPVGSGLYFTEKTDLRRQKQSVFTLQLFRQDQSLLSLYRLRFSLLLCNLLKIHFSLLQSAFLLTAECISPYCRLHFFLLHLVFKRSCSPHTKPDRDRNWRVLSEKLIAKAKWNRLY